MNSLTLDRNQAISISLRDRLRNIFITGLIADEISSYAAQLILQDIQSSRGTIVIDQTGDIADILISSIPHQYQDHVVYIDPWSYDYPIGVNIFRVRNESEKNDLAGFLIELMHHLYDPQHTGIIGPRFEHAVRNACLTILYDKQPTFLELLRCLTDNQYLTQLFPQIKDEVVKNYWTKQIAQTSDFHKSEVLDYIVSKFSAFIHDKKIRNIICQTVTSFSISQLLAGNKTVIFDLSNNYFDNNANKILTALLFRLFEREMNGDVQGINFNSSIYINEVQLLNPAIIMRLLAKSKKIRLPVIALSSRLKLVNKELLYELLRAGTIVGLRQNNEDAQILQKKAGFNLNLLTINLKKHQGVVKQYMDEGVSYKLIDTIVPSKRNDVNAILAIKTSSQTLFGTPREKVEKDIEARMLRLP